MPKQTCIAYVTLVGVLILGAIFYSVLRCYIDEERNNSAADNTQTASKGCTPNRLEAGMVINTTQPNNHSKEKNTEDNNYSDDDNNTDSENDSVRLLDVREYMHRHPGLVVEILHKSS